MTRAIVALTLLAACQARSGKRGVLPSLDGLHNAALHGDLPEVERLLGQTRDRQRISEALITAAGGGHQAVAERLLQAGADVNVHDHEHGGITPLILAAYGQQPKLIAWLLSKHADPNLKNDDQETPLHTAAKGPSDEVVRLLLEAGAKADALDVHGRTPLIQHAQEGNSACVSLLLEKKSPIDIADQDGITALMVASANGRVEVVRLLLGKANPLLRDKRGYTAFGMAVANDHAAALTPLFVASKVDLDAASKIGGALATAVYHNRPQALPLLLRAGAGVDAQPTEESMTALLVAAAREELEQVRTLVAAGAGLEVPNARGAMPLHIAAASGSLPVVQFLVERGARINATNKLGSTPIRAAADTGKLEVVRWLLQHGAKPNIPDQWGRLPIDYARDNKHDDVVKLLKER